MPIDTLTGQLELKLTINAANDITGSDYSPVSNNTNITKTAAYTSATANGSAGGADQVVSFVQSVAAGGNATIDLTAITNILQETSQTFARIKQILIRLLSTTDDSTNGTNATSITIGNASANGHALFVGNTAQTFTIPNGGGIGYIGNMTAGLTVNSTQKNVFIENDDGSNIAKVQLSFVGGDD